MQKDVACNTKQHEYLLVFLFVTLSYVNEKFEKRFHFSRLHFCRYFSLFNLSEDLGQPVLFVLPTLTYIYVARDFFYCLADDHHHQQPNEKLSIATCEKRSSAMKS